MKPLNAFRCLAAARGAILLAFAHVVAAQEQAQPPQLFVSDKLVVNVYAEPNQGGERVATIETGDAVAELERADNFVRVRLENGREGWVGANYLTTDAPAAVRLRDLQRNEKSAVQAAEQKSADEIARLKKNAAKLQAELAELKAIATSTAPSAAASVMAAPIEDATDSFETAAQPPAAAGASQNEGGSVWLWPGIVLLAVGLGFAAGYQTLASRIRKKFGGLKIY
jgi:SH3 domain protein